MGIARGTNIVRDGLVFGYDTGYGVADKNTSTRFYKGRPTTNEINLANDDLNNWTSYENGNDGTFTTEFGTVGVKINNRASWNGLYKGFTLPSTGTYTFSGWFRYRGGTSNNNGATVYISSYGGSDTATALDKTKVGEWQRVTKTVNVTDVTVTFYIISYGGSQSSDTSSWDVTMPQIEKLSDETPFVNGSRSNTNSLIDLKRTTNIDLSSVSFNSSGQPDYDGTDDKGVVSNFPHVWDSSVSMECVIKFEDTGRSIIFGNYNQGSDGGDVNFEHSDRELRIYWNRGEKNVWTSGDVVTADGSSYHHCVFVRDTVNNQFRVYVDGSQVHLVTGVGTNITQNNVGTNHSTFRIGGDTRNGDTIHNGEIPIIKVYNKALSATEITQNYNAYKNRFNI